MRQLVVVVIRVYQRIFSPFLPPSCRFYPSCSEYARQAIVKHGFIRGITLAATRVARCHPWNSGGVDPVP